MKSSPARLKPFGHTGALTEDVEFSLKTVYHIFQLFFFLLVAGINHQNIVS